MVTWGANTTALFGAGTTAAASTTPAPAATGFAFGGGAPATPPAASTPAPANPPPLGSTTTAAAPSTSLFGGQPAAPAAGGLFGGTPAPAPAGGLFGSTPAPAPGGLFGTTPAPAPAGGLFGSTAAPAPATGGLFGSNTTAAPTSAFGAAPAPSAYGGGFPTQQPQQQANPHQAALHAHQSASQRQEAARIEEAIFNLHSKYSPNAADPLNPALASNNTPSSLCAFTAILYDPLPPQHREQGHLSVPKPPHISNQVWNEALARTPSKELVPVPLVGAPALHSRIVSQQEKANALAAHAKKLRETLQFLEKAARSSKDAIKHSNSEQEVLRRRLLEIMRKVEIVRCMGQPTQRAEVDAQHRLGEIMNQVNVVGKSLADLEERGREQARAWRMRGATMKSQHSDDIGSAPLQEEDKAALFDVLNNQRLGMERLGNIVRRDVRDVGILKDELNNASTGRVKALPPTGAAIFGR
ncbi:hypothetical protein ACHAXR_008635 [Thalassiosira sp. AJA248-18]